MGNSRNGFEIPPRGYLRELRREAYICARSISSSQSRRSLDRGQKNHILPNESPKKELHEHTVQEFLLNNTNFFDDFVKTHVSQGRIKAWLKLSESAKLRPGEESASTSFDNTESFAAEIVERSFRQRTALIITRNHFLYPLSFDKEELYVLFSNPYRKDEFSELDSHLFPYREISTDDINRVFINMVVELFGQYGFPNAELCYFLSSLKVNYFNVEYHNYSHALGSAQTMFWILKNHPGIFTEIEMKALMIASISHAVGHFGINETYIKEMGYGLEKMYHNPILKHHHIQVCFMILEDINCNVFSDLDAGDYRRVLQLIRHAIRSTDANRYELQIETMEELLESRLDFENAEVKKAMMSIMMMACDLFPAWKRWRDHKGSVWCLYKEFFNQGEKEEQFGLDSTPQMLRKNSENIPAFQLAFLEKVVQPFFELVVKIFPNCSPILKETSENIRLWKTYQANLFIGSSF